VVGFIHTHPYSVGEIVLVCDASGNVTGARPYDGTPSEPDRQTSVALGLALGRGEPLAGIILDANGIRVFKGEGTEVIADVPRCGY
jgi:hypothetical protein